MRGLCFPPENRVSGSTQMTNIVGFDVELTWHRVTIYCIGIKEKKTYICAKNKTTFQSFLLRFHIEERITNKLPMYDKSTTINLGNTTLQPTTLLRDFH